MAFELICQASRTTLKYRFDDWPEVCIAPDL
jgi:hypothetical protein